MSIETLYLLCLEKDEIALELLVRRFHPLLMKVSWRYGYFDEDCYQECVIAMIKAVEKFTIR